MGIRDRDHRIRVAMYQQQRYRVDASHVIDCGVVLELLVEPVRRRREVETPDDPDLFSDLQEDEQVLPRKERREPRGGRARRKPVDSAVPRNELDGERPAGGKPDHEHFLEPVSQASADKVHYGLDVTVPAPDVKVSFRGSGPSHVEGERGVTALCDLRCQ